MMVARDGVDRRRQSFLGFTKTYLQWLGTHGRHRGHWKARQVKRGLFCGL